MLPAASERTTRTIHGLFRDIAVTGNGTRGTNNQLFTASSLAKLVHYRSTLREAFHSKNSVSVMLLPTCVNGIQSRELTGRKLVPFVGLVIDCNGTVAQTLLRTPKMKRMFGLSAVATMLVASVIGCSASTEPSSMIEDADQAAIDAYDASIAEEEKLMNESPPIEE